MGDEFDSRSEWNGVERATGIEPALSAWEAPNNNALTRYYTIEID